MKEGDKNVIGQVSELHSNYLDPAQQENKLKAQETLWAGNNVQVEHTGSQNHLI